MESPTNPAVVPTPPSPRPPPSHRRPCHPASVPGRKRLPRIVLAILLIAAVAVAVPALWNWVEFRRTHSITDDAFVEAHIVNIAPQMVSGRIVRFLVEEDDRVEPGQILAEIDPIPYRDKVNLSRAKLDAARADLARQEADLERVRKEVPIQIAIAGRTLAAATTDRAKAEEGLKLTRDEVEKDIDEARAGVKAARASLTLAELEYGRFSRLTEQGASTKERQQQVTQSRDSAQAQVELAEAKLSKALVSRTQVDIARHSLEAAQTGTEKAVQGRRPLAARLRPDPRARAAGEGQGADGPGGRRGPWKRPSTTSNTPRSGLPSPAWSSSATGTSGDFAPAGATLLSLYNPDLLYVEANLEETRLPEVAPGNPVRIEIDAFDRAVPGPGRLDQQVDRGAVRADAAQRRLRRVHPGGPARPGADLDRAGRPLADAPRRPVGAGGHRPRRRATRPGPRRRPGSWRSTRPATTSPRPTGRHRHHDAPTVDTTARDGSADRRAPARRPGRRHVLAALAIFLVLVTVYQTLVLTVVTDDVIRKGIEADEYDMIWVNVAWGVAILYSLFGAFWLAGRYRDADHAGLGPGVLRRSGTSSWARPST